VGEEEEVEVEEEEKKMKKKKRQRKWKMGRKWMKWGKERTFETKWMTSGNNKKNKCQ
jgi:hypothetical protein